LNITDDWFFGNTHSTVWFV